MKLLVCFLLLAGGPLKAFPLTGTAQDQQRRVVPDKAAQKAAAQLIREVFNEEYSKKSHEDQVRLAKALLREGGDSTDDAATQFVLLRDARDIAAKQGDAETALRAIDEMGKRFMIEPLRMKSSTLSKVGRKAKTRKELTGLVRLSLSLAEDAGDADDYKTASEAAASALKFAKRLKDKNVIRRARARESHFAGLKKSYAKVRSAKAKLAEWPDDEDANRIVGRFLCMSKGDWERGLPLLVKCGDAAMQQLAERDMSNPSDAGERAKIGEGWWDLSREEKGIEKKSALRRAAYWYTQSVGELSGLAQAQVKKRLRKIRWKLSDAGWEDYTDPTLFGLTGERGDAINLAPGPGVLLVTMSSFPEGEFNGVSVRIRFDPEIETRASFIVEGDERLFSIDSGKNRVIAFRKSGRKWLEENGKNIPKRDAYVLTALLVDGKYVITVDGEEKLRIKAKVPLIDLLYLQVNTGSAWFDEIRLHLKQ